MGRYQYTAENDDYEADLERIRISRKTRKSQKTPGKTDGAAGKIKCKNCDPCYRRLDLSKPASFQCSNSHPDGNESEKFPL